MKQGNIDLSEVKKTLPHGALSIIAKNSGKSIETVSKVIHGKSKNFDVLMALSEYVIEHKQKERKMYDAMTKACSESI